MKYTYNMIAFILLIAISRDAFGHGFGLMLQQDSNQTPISIGSSSESTLPPSDGDAEGPGNLFFDSFSGTANPDGSYRSSEGFAFTAGTWPPGSTYTFNIISRLWFANGSGEAVPATPGTYIHITDLYVGDPGHPGASNGSTDVYGNVSSAPGFQVSMTDPHELLKKIYFRPEASTYGAFGFAFNVTAHFTSGQMLTSGPLVDIWMTDIGAEGGFATFATAQEQESAIAAIYHAVMQGDFNIDGTASTADLPILLKALTDLDAYKMSQSILNRELLAIGDSDGDGAVTNLDIQPFLNFLANQGAPQPVPEPQSGLLAVIGFGFLFIHRWRRTAADG